MQRLTIIERKVEATESLLASTTCPAIRQACLEHIRHLTSAARLQGKQVVPAAGCRYRPQPEEVRALQRLTRRA